MVPELDARKAPPKRVKAPVRAGAAARLRAFGVRALVLYVLAYGGMVVVAVVLVASAVRSGGEASPPALSLHAAAGDRAFRTLAADTARGAADASGGPDGGPASGGAPHVLPGAEALASPRGGREAGGAPAEPAGGGEQAAPGGVIVASPEDALRPPVAPARAPRTTPDAGPPGTSASGATAEPAEPLPLDGCRRYPVLAGDATGTVARRLGIRRRDLRRWNPDLGSEGPRAGAKLRICSDKKAIVGWTEKRIAVRRGDTVLRIARRFGLSIGNVVAANGIHPDRIHVGQELVVFEPIWK